MKNLITMPRCCAIAALVMMTFTSCTKEENMPTPQEETVVSTPVTSTQSVVQDWKLDSIVFFDNGVMSMSSLPSNSSVGMILYTDGTSFNGNQFTAQGTWSFDDNTMYLTTTDTRISSGVVQLSSTTLMIADTTDGSLGNTVWTDSKVYYTKR